MNYIRTVCLKSMGCKVVDKEFLFQRHSIIVIGAYIKQRKNLLFQVRYSMMEIGCFEWKIALIR